MEDGSPIWGLIIFIIFLIVHAILYGFESAIQNLNESDLEKKAEDGDKKSKKLLHIINEPEYFINTLLTIITLLDILVGSYVYWLLSRELGRFFSNDSTNNWQYYGEFLLVRILPAIILLVIGIVFGVLVPKKIAHKYSNGWAYRLVGFISQVNFILSPIIMLITKMANLIVRCMGVNPHDEGDNVTEEEIMLMVNEGHEQGVLLASEAEMITNIFEFGDKQAEEIMTHRRNMIAVDGNWTLQETIDFIIKQHKSRFPIYDKDIDNIIGVLHFKDAIIYYEKHDTNVPIGQIKELIREVHFIPETRNINLLFKEMQSQKIHMVVVVDEYGQTAGLVAMEDILEEIVGNILDEYDDEDDMVIKQEDGSFMIRGMAKLEEVWESLGIEEQEEEEEYDTLNGFLIAQLDRIPQDDEKLEVRYRDYIFSAIRVKKKTIQLVHVKKEKKTEKKELA